VPIVVFESLRGKRIEERRKYGFVLLSWCCSMGGGDVELGGGEQMSNVAAVIRM
jgi:hypothetical protein